MTSRHPDPAYPTLAELDLDDRTELLAKITYALETLTFAADPDSPVVERLGREYDNLLDLDDEELPCLLREIESATHYVLVAKLAEREALAAE